jgi:hypothetical protein
MRRWRLCDSRIDLRYLLDDYVGMVLYMSRKSLALIYTCFSRVTGHWEKASRWESRSGFSRQAFLRVYREPFEEERTTNHAGTTFESKILCIISPMHSSPLLQTRYLCCSLRHPSVRHHFRVYRPSMTGCPFHRLCEIGFL